MKELLIEFFDQLTPAELDLLLGDDFKKEPLEADSMTRIQTKVLSAIQVRRRPKHAIHWAVAAVLAVVIGVGGLTMLPGGWSIGPGDPVAEVPPTDDPEPAVSEYDIFSDPNVLWGDKNDEKSDDNDWIPSGTVIISASLENTISSASEENLIAFIIEPIYGQIYFDFPIHIEKLAIHEELDPEGVLTELIRNLCESGKWEDYNKISEYLLTFGTKYINPIDAEIYDIRNQVFADLRNEHGCISDNVSEWDEWDILWEESLTLAKQDAHFRELYDQYKYYIGIVQNFWYSWEAQQIEGLRNQMITNGFVPVYSVDEVYQAEYEKLPYISSEHRYPGNAPIEQYESLMLLFVGSQAQIYQFEKDVEEKGVDSYYLWSSDPMEQYFTVRD